MNPSREDLHAETSPTRGPVAEGLVPKSLGLPPLRFWKWLPLHFLRCGRAALPAVGSLPESRALRVQVAAALVRPWEEVSSASPSSTAFPLSLELTSTMNETF